MFMMQNMVGMMQALQVSQQKLKEETESVDYA
jgi:hypothetical protein